jgi:prepilin-type processing-associated H-X9-DG protein
MLVEAADAGIAWTEPRDLSLDALATAGDKSPALTVSSHHSREDFFFKYDRTSGANVAMADGSVSYLPPGGLSIENLRKILHIDGCPWRDPRFEPDLQYDEHRRLNWPNAGQTYGPAQRPGRRSCRSLRREPQVYYCCGG